MNIETKRQKEKDTVALMIEIYCKKHHKSKHLCQECQQLKDYAFTRSDKCPFMETKTFCSNCKVHCYRSDMQQKFVKLWHILDLECYSITLLWQSNM